jgi:hypothetical protein
MDTQTLQSGGASAGFIFAIGLLYKLYKVINHHRIRSRCCGRTLDASIDIDGTSPSVAVSPPATAPLAQKTSTSLETIKIPEGS